MILVRVNVKDFDRYWSVFTTAAAEKRSQYESRGARVFRNEDDASEVVILFDWDRAQFERFREDTEVPEILRSAGALATPQHWFLSPAGETQS